MDDIQFGGKDINQNTVNLILRGAREAKPEKMMNDGQRRLLLL